MTVKKADAVRILSTVLLAGEKYQPNELVAGIPENERASLVKSGMVSDRDVDIKYCTDNLKSLVHQYAQPRTEPKKEQDEEQ